MKLASNSWFYFPSEIFYYSGVFVSHGFSKAVQRGFLNIISCVCASAGNSASSTISKELVQLEKGWSEVSCSL